MEQTHYQTQFNAMVADNTDLRTAAELTAQYHDTDGSGTIEPDERTPGNEVDGITDAQRTELYSMKTRYDALQAANTARDNAGVTLDVGSNDTRNGHRSRADRLHEPAGLLPIVGGPSFRLEEPGRR